MEFLVRIAKDDKFFISITGYVPLILEFELLNP